jgi:hypothetical protein
VALQLAAIDMFFRSGCNPHHWRDDIEDVDPLAVEEIVSMLEHAPFDKLTSRGPMLLNPTFGRYSEAVGGGDADLVIGDLLLDIKTSRKLEVQPAHLRQLFGYFLLARGMRRDDPRFPEIHHLGIYFPRFAFVWTFPAVLLMDQPAFPDTEAWFIAQAMGERKLPPRPLHVQTVEEWLHSEPPALGTPPDWISSTLPSEEVHQRLLERFLQERSRSRNGRPPRVL